MTTNKKVHVAGVPFSEEEIQQMKAGASVAKRLHTDGQQATQQVLNTVDANQAAPGAAIWGSAPRIGEGQKVAKPFADVPKVTRPNIDRFNADHAKQQAERLAFEEEQRAKQEALQEVVAPEALHNSLQAMNRKIAKLEKLVKQLQAGEDA